MGFGSLFKAKGSGRPRDGGSFVVCFVYVSLMSLSCLASPSSAPANLHPTMDAPDDREVKLQRASGDLVLEFSAKLPSLLWKFPKGQDSRVVRRWSPAAKTEKLVTLVCLCPVYIIGI